MTLEAFSYGGVDFSPYFVVQKVTIPFLDMQGQYTDFGSADGSLFMYSKRLKGAVTIEATIVTDHSKMTVLDTKDKIVAMLATKGLQKLVVPQVPGRYFNAIYDGTLNYDATDDGLADKLSLVFTVPDGLSHALTPTTATNENSDGTFADTITVDYQGTYPAYPILTATMKSENGLVAFANDKGGVLQFGNPDEVDTVTKVKSDKVIDDGMRTGQTGYTFNTGPITYAKYVGTGGANTFDGSIKFIGETAEPQFVNDTIKHWHGPSMHRTVPTNSLGDNTGSFIWRTRFNYNTDAKGLGYLEINLTSGGKVIASFAMYDGNSSIVEQKTQYFVNGKQIKSVAMNQRLFGNGFYELTVTRSQGRGNFKLSKVAKLNGEEVVPGSTYQVPFVDPTFDTAVIDGVTIWFMKFTNSKATSMNVSDMKFHWINVPYIEDVPNRFDTGDVVTIDVANRKIYVNDVLDNTLQTVGNQWESFALQPGTTTIQPVASSWATMYDCKLTYREAWL